MDYIVIISLSLIVLLVLVLPLTVHKVEENLEPFLFIMGVLAVTITKQWSGHLVWEAVKEPVMITLAVAILGFAFKFLNRNFRYAMLKTSHKIGFRLTIFLLVLALGFLSSVITAIVAAVMLAEAVSALGLKDESKLKVVVFACFAIGLGAVLTPIGEPLSTITIAKLKGPEHNAGFFYLVKLLGIYVIPGVVAFALLSAWIPQKRASVLNSEGPSQENNKDIAIRSVKVYAFVGALVLLGAGLRPLAEITVYRLSAPVLYWVNSVSAILDNATLAAIEIVPAMDQHTLIFLLMGLILAGGLLIPGNIPNIISASKLKIKSGAWAKIAIPWGVAFMVVYFIIMMAVLNV